jgi:cell division protein FtsI/penicillin-binding protein 2
MILQTLSRRTTLLWLTFLGLFVCIVFRLYYWQVVSSKELSAKAFEQYHVEGSVDAPRGAILARDGTPLVVTTDAYRLIVDKTILTTNPFELANRLAPLLVSTDSAGIALEESRIRDLLSNEKTVWVPIKQKISQSTQSKLASYNIAGLVYEKIQDRFYPEASSAAQILGFVGKTDEGENTGYFGLEGEYNISLSGKPGFVRREANAIGATLFFGDSEDISARSGVTLHTTLDKRFQLTAEKKLEEGILKYGAKSGTVIAMDPATGGILAMASYPSYDPSTYWKYSNDLYKNPAISDAFEPGSIMKPLIMAAALDMHLITPQTECSICDGPYKIDKYFIETWDNNYYPHSTMTDVIVHSDNVGMVDVGNHLGLPNLLKYLQSYGFGHATGIDLQGEAVPPFRSANEWNIVDAATATFGQGIAATPIQMIRALGSIASGGLLVTPHVVASVESDSSTKDIELPTQPRVLSESATQQVTDMMIAAVKKGEAKWAVPKGFVIAGKTGTAQIPVAGHYDPTKTVASFIGFAPAKNPKFVMLVILKEPSTSQWGSETAAPLWFSIAKDLFPYFGIRPEN